MAPDLAASVRARLLAIAKAEATDFDTILCAMPHRPTRDVDLLGSGASDLDSVAQAFREALDAGTLASAIAATFARRGTPLPTELPIGLF